MSEHTPTPWAIDPMSDETIAIYAPDGEHHICTLEIRDEFEDKFEDRREADAEFICRACNNFDAMLAACKHARTALEWMSRSDCLDVATKRDCEIACAPIAIAIANAEHGGQHE